MLAIIPVTSMIAYFGFGDRDFRESAKIDRDNLISAGYYKALTTNQE